MHIKPEERIAQLRHQVSYLDGRRKVMAMNELAECLIRSRPREAASIAEEALQRARALLERLPSETTNRDIYNKTLAYALYVKGRSRLSRVEQSDVTQFLEEAAQLLEQIGDWDKLYDVLDYQALNHRQFARMDKALELVEKALALAAMQGRPSFLCKFYAARASINVRLKQDEATAADTVKALELLEECEDTTDRMQALVAVAELYYHAQDFDQAIKYYVETITCCRLLNAFNTQATCHWQLHFCYYYTGRKELLRANLEEGFRCARDDGFVLMEAVFADELGNLAYGEGDLTSLLEYWHHAEELFEQIGDLFGLTSTLMSLAKALIQFEDLEHGRQTAHRAFNLMIQADPHPLTVGSITRLLRYDVWEEKHYREILSFGARSRDYLNKYAGSDLLISTCLCEAVAHIKLEQYAQAKLVLQEALPEAQSRKVVYVTVRIHILYARMFNEQKEYEAALDHLQKAQAMGDEDISASNREDIALLLLDVYEQQGNHAEAFKQLRILYKKQIERHKKRNRSEVGASLEIIESKKLKRELTDAKQGVRSLKNENERLQQSLRVKSVQLEYMHNLLRDWRDELGRSVGKDVEISPADMRGLLNSITTALSSNIGEEVLQAIGGREEFELQLSKIYPALSERERKVCGLIRSGTGSKDVCRILNVSPRTIETYRYRIRRKLELDADTDLNLFLQNLKPE